MSNHIPVPHDKGDVAREGAPFIGATSLEELNNVCTVSAII